MEGRDWTKHYTTSSFAGYRTTPHMVSEILPAELFMGKRLDDNLQRGSITEAHWQQRLRESDTRVKLRQRSMQIAGFQQGTVTLGKKIRFCLTRAARGLSSQDLAQILSAHRRTIGRWSQNPPKVAIPSLPTNNLELSYQPWQVPFRLVKRHRVL